MDTVEWRAHFTHNLFSCQLLHHVDWKSNSEGGFTQRAVIHIKQILVCLSHFLWNDVKMSHGNEELYVAFYSYPDARNG